MKNRMMTKKEMISACVDDQIARGFAKAENRELQINARLKGLAGVGIKAMSYAECLKWYEDVFKTA